MKVRIEIGFKPGVLDPEAATIERSLHGLGFTGVAGLRREKLIEFELPEASAAEANAQAEAMCQRLLANPVIETYRIDVLA